MKKSIRKLYVRLFPSIMNVYRFDYEDNGKKLVWRKTMKKLEFLEEIKRSPYNIHASINVPFKRFYVARGLFIDVDNKDLSTIREIADFFGNEPLIIETDRGYHVVYLLREKARKGDIVFVASQLSKIKNVDVGALIVLERGIRVPYTLSIRKNCVRINKVIDINGNMIPPEDVKIPYISLEEIEDNTLSKFTDTYKIPEGYIPQYILDVVYQAKMWKLIDNLIFGRDVSHWARVCIVSFLRLLGWTKSEVKKLFEIRADYDEAKTEKYVTWIFKRKYFPPKIDLLPDE